MKVLTTLFLLIFSIVFKSFFDLFGFTKIQDEQLLAAQSLLLSSEGNSSK